MWHWTIFGAGRFDWSHNVWSETSKPVTASLQMISTSCSPEKFPNPHKMFLFYFFCFFFIIFQESIAQNVIPQPLSTSFIIADSRWRRVSFLFFPNPPPLYSSAWHLLYSITLLVVADEQVLLINVNKIGGGGGNSSWFSFLVIFFFVGDVVSRILSFFLYVH